MDRRRFIRNSVGFAACMSLGATSQAQTSDGRVFYVTPDDRHRYPPPPASFAPQDHRIIPVERNMHIRWWGQCLEQNNSIATGAVSQYTMAMPNTLIQRGEVHYKNANDTGIIGSGYFLAQNQPTWLSFYYNRLPSSQRYVRHNNILLFNLIHHQQSGAHGAFRWWIALGPNQAELAAVTLPYPS